MMGGPAPVGDYPSHPASSGLVAVALRATVPRTECAGYQGGPATPRVRVLSGWPKATGGDPRSLITWVERNLPVTSCALRAPGQQVVRATQIRCVYVTGKRYRTGFPRRDDEIYLSLRPKAMAIISKTEST